MCSAKLKSRFSGMHLAIMLNDWMGPRFGDSNHKLAVFKRADDEFFARLLQKGKLFALDYFVCNAEIACAGVNKSSDLSRRWLLFQNLDEGVVCHRLGSQPA